MLINVHVKLAGIIAASLGYQEKALELPAGATVRDLLECIGLPVSQRWTVTSVNGAVREKRTVLQDGDEVFVVPVGGGG